MLPLMLCAGVGSELLNLGDAIGFVGRSAVPKEIGRFESKHSQAVYYFRGSLAELHLYSRVLTAEEIRRLAQ